MPEKKTFKSGEEVRTEITQKFNALNVDASVQQSILDLVLEENRQAWIRGKEYGWTKAWNWKRKKEAQSA
ncbi:hypothetical protein COV06_03415 [Candidatus Uhrbacteria bacterium CG10_big_fil_rev_8_21_14_0_10_50_16]|uniref:Uncharacterized protein n=1 Tax=Candidatus Uhrbacteria bacterium CG10_big_fil_rev_8_21_14_0_10_50_16 TaxID=1975039 RepID=A0A2H0RLV3_9BACT|nr:MAG: hypothetical protein COV06_03415 [Candidatus Uhrbacteria bacterium CG10_big_fil_rev_8_21_14_0_10_50_16]